METVYYNYGGNVLKTQYLTSDVCFDHAVPCFVINIHVLLILFCYCLRSGVSKCILKALICVPISDCLH